MQTILNVSTTACKTVGAFSSVCQILSKIMLTKNAFVELACCSQ